MKSKGKCSNGSTVGQDSDTKLGESVVAPPEAFVAEL